jgi:RNA polymerase sigma-70 factor, ECF subfamily
VLYGPIAALAMIEPLAGPLAGYFNFHGLKGGLLMQLDRPLEARHALDKAISLARSAVEANHIRQRLDALLDAGAERGADTTNSRP